MAQLPAKSLQSGWSEVLAVEVEEEDGTESWRHSMESVLSSGTSIPAIRHPLLLPIAAAGVALPLIVGALRVIKLKEEIENVAVGREENGGGEWSKQGFRVNWEGELLRGFLSWKS